MTHLEYEWESPVWRTGSRFFSDHFRFVRYDERGCGMTTGMSATSPFERWVEILEAVVQWANPREARSPCSVISQGAWDGVWPMP